MYTRDEFGGYMYPDNAFQPEFGKGPFSRKMRLYGGGKGSPPDTNPGMIASAEAAKEIAAMQKDTATEYLNFSKQQYEELKPILASITQSQLETDAANRARGADYAAYEKNVYRPLEMSIVSDAMNFDTAGKRRELADRAAADVKSSFGVARDSSQRALASFGINPNSGRFASLNNQLATDEALAVAGAKTRATTDAEMLGYARKMDAAGLGRNLATNASTAYGVSLNASDAANRSALSGANYMGSAYGQAGAMYGGAANSYGAAGNIYGQEFNARMQGYQAQQQASGAFWSGLGSLAGSAAGWSKFGKPGADGAYVTRNGLKLPGYADGTHVGAGPVSGPGGPVDDKIPAMLSDGEYVIPADTVKAIGKDKLDKLVARTHTPAAIQRKRQALKGKK